MVAAVIGALRANLSLNTAEFQRGIQQARRSMQGMADGLQRLAQISAVAGAGLATLGLQSVSAAKEITRLSQVANTTPGELQRWAAATSTVGIEQEKLADILKDVTDRIGDYSITGGGPLVDWMDRVGKKAGITTQHLQQLSGPDALQLIVTSMDDAGLSMQQMTFIMEALASDSTLMLPLLRDNGRALKDLADQAEMSGAVLDDQAIAALTRTSQAVHNVVLSFKGMRNRIAADLAPVVTRAAGLLSESMKEGGALNKIFTTLSDNIGRVGSYLTALVGVLAAYKVAVMAAAVYTRGLQAALIGTGIGIAIVAIGELVNLFIKLRNQLGSTGAAFRAMGQLAKGALNVIVNICIDLANRIIGVFRGLGGALYVVFDSVGTRMKSWGLSIANFMIGAIQGALNGLIAPINGFLSKINSALSVFSDRKIDLIGTIEWEGLETVDVPSVTDTGKKAAAAFMKGMNSKTFNNVKVFDVKGVRDQWKELFDTTVDGTEKIEELTIPAFNGVKDALDGAVEDAHLSRVEKLRDTFGSAFSSIVTGSKSAKQALGDLLQTLATAMANRAFNQFFLKKGIGGSSLFGGAADWLFSSIPGFANGTNNAPGGLAMVGERGPELVNLPRGSRVMTATATASALRQSGGNSHVHISVDEGLRATWMKEAANQSVSITQSGIQQYDQAMPARINQINSDPRRR